MKYKIVTDGTISGSEIYDEDNNLIGGVSSVEIKEQEKIMVIQIGDDKHKPTPTDLQDIRDIFEKAKDDKDFTLYTSWPFEIKYIPKNNEAIVNFNFKMLLK